MTTEVWSRVVSSSVVPVVIISACGLLCLTFYNRLSYIISRLRGFHRERLQIQEDYARSSAAGQPDRFAIDRHRRLLDMLELQTARVTRQARLVRLTLYCLLGTIACLTACSLATGLSVLLPAAKYPAMALFVTGMLLLLAAVVPAILDMRLALAPIELESRFVSRLEDEFEKGANGPAGEPPEVPDRPPEE